MRIISVSIYHSKLSRVPSPASHMTVNVGIAKVIPALPVVGITDEEPVPSMS